MSYRYEQYTERPRNRSRSCLISATVLVWVLVLACIAIPTFVRPAVTDYLNRQVATRIDPQIPADLPGEEALRESLDQVPLDVPVPIGTIQISEADANAYMAAYREQLPGIDDIAVRFVPGAIEADVTFRGFTGTARTEPQVQNGRIVATNTSLGQPLGSLLSIDPLMNALLDRINNQIAEQGRTITSVTIEQGSALVTVE